MTNRWQREVCKGDNWDWRGKEASDTKSSGRWPFEALQELHCACVHWHSRRYPTGYMGVWVWEN